jgi:NAD+ synthase (glutamine-hydrolysing)
MPLCIAVAQLNFVVGDMAGNARRIVEAAHAAHAQGAQLLVTPELALCGYAAEDLFLRPAFMAACDDALAEVARQTRGLSGLTVLVGHPQGGDTRGRSVAVSGRHNRLSVLRAGVVVATYDKRCLPNYQVFDERRYFTPGSQPCVIDVAGTQVGLLICEDAWFEQPAQDCQHAGAQVLVVANASPFHGGKRLEREATMGQRARETGLPLVYAHLVGGQDEVVFEGQSFAVRPDGHVAARALAFQEEIWLCAVSTPQAATEIIALDHPAPDADAELWHALVLGVRDYVGKNGFPGVLLGLSGGIDSALVLAVAVDALGPERVWAVMMPSPYTADISRTDAADMAKRMQVRYEELSIVPMFEAFLTTLAPQWAGRPLDATEENIQARVRGTMLMALSNKFGAIVLTTGNKSEMATGYCTLYGDMAGGFAVIKDLLKTTVFRLARWRNAHDPYGRGANPIPLRIIDRPPSAELRPDQTDQDSLPPYDVLDAILRRYMEEDQPIADIVAVGFDASVVEHVTRLVKINEYKRRQSPVGIRLTHRSFGKDWRYPITSRFRA